MIKSIELTAEDMAAAASAAVIEIVRKVHACRNSDRGNKSIRSVKTRLGHGAHGKMGEIALARLLNIGWTSGGLKITHGDIGHEIECRATEHEKGHMAVYTTDDDHRPCVLMVGDYPYFRIVGWRLIRESKKDEWWRQDLDPPCWFVPQSALDEIEELMEAIRKGTRF